MKKILRSLLLSLLEKRNRRRYAAFLKKETTGELVILDIDNTLAHTWPSLNQKFDSEFERTVSLPPVPKMIEHVRASFSNPKTCTVLYLTARDFRMRKATQIWLEKQGLKFTNSGLLVVEKAAAKLYYLEKALEENLKVKYYDDLSYHHETGLTKFHSELIHRVKSLDLEYTGYYKIQEISDDT